MGITKAQALTESEFHYGKCYQTFSPTGICTQHTERWRRNGQTQVWKTRPDDFRVPIKHGLKHCANITPASAVDFHTSQDCWLWSDEATKEREEQDKRRNLGTRINQLVQGMRPKDRKKVHALTVEQKMLVVDSPIPEAAAMALISEVER